MKFLIQVIISCVVFAFIFAAPAPQNGMSVHPQGGEESGNIDQGQVVGKELSGNGIVNGTDIDSRFGLQGALAIAGGVASALGYAGYRIYNL